MALSLGFGQEIMFVCDSPASFVPRASRGKSKIDEWIAGRIDGWFGRKAFFTCQAEREINKQNQASKGRPRK